MARWRIIALGLALSAPADAQTIAYDGWDGGVDRTPQGVFQGCHLDSPAPTRTYSSRVRIVATPGQDLYIVFNSPTMGNGAPPGTSYETRLTIGGRYWFESTGLKDNDAAAVSSPLTYEATVITALHGGARIGIRMATDDPFLTHFGDGLELQMWWQNAPISYPETIDLRHLALTDPKTWLNVTSENDTDGAIKAVLDCVTQHR